MRKIKYVLTLDDDSYDLIVSAMINFKNKLTRDGKYTDAVDDALIKFVNATLTESAIFLSMITTEPT